MEPIQNFTLPVAENSFAFEDLVDDCISRIFQDLFPLTNTSGFWLVSKRWHKLWFDSLFKASGEISRKAFKQLYDFIKERNGLEGYSDIIKLQFEVGLFDFERFLYFFDLLNSLQTPPSIIIQVRLLAEKQKQNENNEIMRSKFPRLQLTIS